MQKWGWSIISLALLIFMTTYQSKKAFLLFSLVLFLLGIVMVKQGAKKEENDEKS